MPAYSPLYNFDLTGIQADLIIYALNNIELNDIEDDERRKIVDTLSTSKRSFSPRYDPLSEWIDDDPICDI